MIRPGRVESNQEAIQCLCISQSSDAGLGSCWWPLSLMEPVRGAMGI